MTLFLLLSGCLRLVDNPNPADGLDGLSPEWTVLANSSTKTCVIHANGQLWCAVGNASALELTESDVRHVDGATDRLCVVFDDGEVTCGGRAGPTGDWTEVAAGDFYACTLSADGVARYWGDEPQDLDGSWPGPWSSIDVSFELACGIRVDGRVSCWGDDDAQVVGAEPAGDSWVDVLLEERAACVLAEDGALACWGNHRDDLHIAPTETDLVQITGGDGHACGLRHDGGVVCWGNDDWGQSESREGPYVEVSAGGSRTCARTADGHIDCWGRHELAWRPDE